MRVSAIHLRGFRNLDGRVPLSGDLAIVVGENNTGKSNLIDACRLLFDAEAVRGPGRGSPSATLPTTVPAPRVTLAAITS